MKENDFNKGDFEDIFSSSATPDTEEIFSSSSAFFKSELFKKFSFDENLINSEDSIMVNKMLLNNV